MLAITRNWDQATLITLPDGRLASIKHKPMGNKIRLLLEFPQDVQIVREEAVNKTPRPETCKG